MTRNYYYLVAGLPDIVLDGGKKALSVAQFVAETAPLVHPDDASLFELLRYAVDNGNLLAILEKREEDFDERGVFAKDELLEQVKVPDGLPRYMQAYVEAHAEGRAVFADCSPENQLTWLFYDEMCSHGNEFVRRWFTFERDLRNVSAAINCRHAAAQDQSREAAFTLQRAIIGRNDVAETILKSNAPDFSLSSQLPWVERLLGLSRDNLVAYEKNVDTLRWDTLNDLTTFAYFQIETLLAFTIKLGMVERWQGLDEAEGTKRFERLVEELTSGFHLKEEL
jgi:hypothetical protein